MSSTYKEDRSWADNGDGTFSQKVAAQILNHNTSDQGADLSVSAIALSAVAPQAISAGTSQVRFQLKAVAGATAWVNIKFGDISVAVTASTGTTLMAGEGAFFVNVPVGATHFDAIAGSALTLNWTPA